MTGLQALFHPIDQTMEHLWSMAVTRAPRLTHYVFLGADRNSFDAGIEIQVGDQMELAFESHGVILSNPIERFAPASATAALAARADRR